MSDGHDPPVDARLDPWCLVPLEDNVEVLFGYGIHHPVLVGLSWMSTSPVEELDAAAGRAVTRSGRRYELGRRVLLADIPREGEEAWVAFDLMLGSRLDDLEAVPRRAADLESDRTWVAACKAARHLGLPPPGRTPWDVEEFLGEHLTAYLELRGAAKRGEFD
jgi:hypothetical protein